MKKLVLLALSVVTLLTAATVTLDLNRDARTDDEEAIRAVINKQIELWAARLNDYLKQDMLHTENQSEQALLSTTFQLLLLADIRAHLSLLNANRRDGIAPSPKRLSTEVPLSTRELTGYCDSALALDIPDDRRDGMLRRYLDEPVNMIAHPMAFDDGAAFLLGQFVEEWPEKLPDLAIAFLFTVFGDEDPMILAVPFSARS